MNLKYQVDLVQYMKHNDPDLIERKNEITGLLNSAVIVFLYSVMVLFFLLFNRKRINKPNN
jgi:hypothetical protein